MAGHSQPEAGCLLTGARQGLGNGVEHAGGEGG